MDIRVPSRPRIALIVDSESWAFANIARQIKSHLGMSYRFRIIPAAIIDNITQVLLMTADCAVTHFFWRDFLNSVLDDKTRRYLRGLGFRSREEFLRRFVHGRTITTSVYDHLFLAPTEMRARQSLFNTLVKDYTVSSQRLMDIYSNQDGIRKPGMLAEDGVDLALFRPRNLQRFDTLAKRSLVVGWSGNSGWSSERGEDFKGLHTLLMPAVRQLRQEGLDIRLELADRQQGFIPHEEMPAYYSRLDLYACVSKMEGTPNPVLEALACGVPVISTDVGVVPQIFPNDPFEAILPERSIDALKHRLRRFYRANASTIRRMSEHGLERIRYWSWTKKAANFHRFFTRQIETAYVHGKTDIRTHRVRPAHHP